MNSFNVGIMTMHRISNYGSTLQAYALKRMIEETIGNADVSFIDFRREEGSVPGHGVRSTAVRTLRKIHEYGSVDAPLLHRVQFLNHKRRYGDKYLPLLGVSSRHVYSSNVDLHVVGSDEVFNCLQSNERIGYSPELFGAGSQARKLVTYAASFGNTTLRGLRERGKADEIRVLLNRFDHLSVRDENSAALVENLTGRKAQIHIDPVLAYSFDPEKARLASVEVRRSPYLIVYGYSGRFTSQENLAVRKFARERGLRIISIGGVQGCADEFVDCDPLTLLAYFRDATAVVTDTFHGTILSIIHQRPFSVLVRSSADGGYGNEEKLGYLLRSMGLDAHRVSSVRSIEDVLGNDPDYESVAQVLEVERGLAKAYLAHIVSASHGAGRNV